jgi:hypothetical protein
MLQQYAARREDQESLLKNMNSKYYYYTRTKGLFRICYPKERPPTGKSALQYPGTLMPFCRAAINRQ